MAEGGGFANADKQNWLRCVECRFVFSDSPTFESGFMCPKCGSLGLQTPFPRVEAWHLVEIVMEHAARLDPDSVERERDMIAKLAAAGLGTLSASEVREIAAEARLSVERGGYDALSEIGADLSRRGVSQDSALTLALELLVIAGQASPDVEAVIVLAATSLEALLDELWTETLASFGLADDAVSPLAALVRRTSVPRQRVLLSDLVEPATGRFPFDREFINRWDQVLEHRNAVVHGRPFLVSMSCAQQAAELASDAVGAFAEANNRMLEAAAAEPTKDPTAGHARPAPIFPASRGPARETTR